MNTILYQDWSADKIARICCQFTDTVMVFKDVPVHIRTQKKVQCTRKVLHIDDTLSSLLFGFKSIPKYNNLELFPLRSS